MYKVDCSLADPLLLNWVGLTQKYNKQGKLLKLRDKFQEAWEMGQFKPSISSSFFFFLRRGIKDCTPQILEGMGDGTIQTFYWLPGLEGG